MDQKKKRIRSANFTPEEKKCCLQLALKYKHIIENKKTDGTSKDQKERAWEKIAHEFNAFCPSMISRSTENLKNFFDNQKRSVRKKVAKINFGKKQTGGGPPEANEDDPLMDMTLEVMNEKTVFGLTNSFDDDAMSELTTEVLDSNKLLTDEAENAIATNIVHSENEQLLQYVEQLPENNSFLNSIILENNNHNDKENFQKKKVPSATLTSNTWESRRRPLGNMSLNLVKMYEDLAIQKVELAKLQLSLLQNQKLQEEQFYKKQLADQELKKKRDTLKFQLEKKTLLSQIAKNREEKFYWKMRRENECHNGKSCK